MQLFFSKQIINGTALLSEEESRHCVNVLRKKLGDVVQLIDGQGSVHQVKIVDAHPKCCRLEILQSEKMTLGRNHYLHIAIAPTKNIDRFEWFLEKAVELGIDEITPILCKHSERKILKYDRLDKIVISAMKQSMNVFYPKINSLLPIDQLLTTHHQGLCLIAHCADVPNKNEFKDLIKGHDKRLILIGPEGDFSENEINLALKNGFQSTLLGSSRLRTETAGIYVCAVSNTID